MIDALVSGKLFGKPVERTTKNGSRFATAKVRAAAGEETIFCNVIAFSASAVTALLALDDGDAVALAGELTAKVWTDRNGEAKPSLDLKAHAVLTGYHVRRRRRAVQGEDEDKSAGNGTTRERPAEPVPFDDPL